MADDAAFRGLLAVVVALSALAVAINIAAAIVLGSSRLSRWPVKAAMGSLTASDLLLAVATLSLGVLEYSSLDEAQAPAAANASSAAAAAALAANLSAKRRFFCIKTVVQWLWDAASTANLLTLLAMAVEHFVGVRWPLHYTRCLRRARVLSALGLVWTASLALGFAPGVFIAAARHEAMDRWADKGTTRFCYQVIVYASMLPNGTHKYALDQDAHERSLRGIGVGTVLAVLAAIAAIYAYFFCVVRRLSLADRKLRPAACSRRAVVTTLILTATFCLCYLPYFFASLVALIASALSGGGGGGSSGSGSGRGGGPNPSYDNAGYGSRTLSLALNFTVFMTSLADPFIYVSRMKEVRRGMQRGLRSVFRSSSH